MKQNKWKEANTKEENVIQARVVEVQKELFVVCYEWEGIFQRRPARLKASAFYYNQKATANDYPVIGDDVRVWRNEQGEDRIEEVLPRRSWLSRPNPATSGQTEQGIAANFDVILLIQSLNQNLNPRRMER